MTPQETVILARYVRALCPQQKFDEFTADAWHDVLGDLALADCRVAAVEVAKQQPFVAPAEIRAQVRAVRDERLRRNPPPPPPRELTDDPEAYRRYLRESTEAIASGSGTRQLRAIGGGE